MNNSDVHIQNQLTSSGMEAEFIPGKKFGSSYLVDTNNFLYSRVYNKKDDEGKIRTLSKCIVNKSPNICLSSLGLLPLLGIGNYKTHRLTI